MQDEQLINTSTNSNQPISSSDSEQEENDQIQRKQTKRKRSVETLTIQRKHIPLSLKPISDEELKQLPVSDLMKSNWLYIFILLGIGQLPSKATRLESTNFLPIGAPSEPKASFRLRSPIGRKLNGSDRVALHRNRSVLYHACTIIYCMHNIYIPHYTRTLVHLMQ